MNQYCDKCPIQINVIECKAIQVNLTFDTFLKLALAPYDFAFYPLHGKRFSDLDELRTESDL